MRNRTGLIFIVSLFLALFACDDPWEDHLEEFSTAKATQNLLEIIQSTPELSSFNQMIEDASLGELFSSSQVSTVWAPTNAAIGDINLDFQSDPDKLIQFVENHIARGMYPLSTQQKDIRCKMLNTKRIPMNMSDGKIYDEAISGDYNKVATNGIVHMIDKTIELRPSIWEFIEETDLDLAQVQFLNSITGTLFVDSLAEIIGFDPITSEPIYDTLSGTIWYNQYIFENADLRTEDSIFTFLILEDDIYNTQFERFKPYYKLDVKDPRDTTELWNYMVTVDLVASGYLTPEELDGYMTSVNGIRVPFESGAVIETIEASNGVIYRLSNCDLSLVEKFPPIIVEAEAEDKIIYTGGGSDGYTRKKALASGGYDFVLDDHDGNPGKVIYHAGLVAATKYEFYWVAVDDFGHTYRGAAVDTIRQKLERVIYVPTNPVETRFPVQPPSISDSLLYISDPSYETAEERYAGAFTFKYYSDLWFHLIGSGNNTTMTLDYVRLVPVFEE